METKPLEIQSKNTEPAKDTIIITGAEQTKLYLPLLKGKTVALVVNQTSLIGKTHLVDSLIKLGINIKTIFAPEHGFRGDHSAGAKVTSSIDEKTGIKITSLYGKEEVGQRQRTACLKTTAK